jgi:hypothetical protein
MEGAVGVEQPWPPGMSTRKFDRGFDSFTARTSEKNFRQPAARTEAQFFCKLACRFRHMGLNHRRALALQFFAKCGNHSGVVVTDVVNAISGKEIEDASAIGSE